MNTSKRRRRDRRTLHRRLGFLENLEHRRLLAGNLIDVVADPFADVAVSEGPVAPSASFETLSADTTVVSSGPTAPSPQASTFTLPLVTTGAGPSAPGSLLTQTVDEPEGEAEQDLVQFAKDLTAAGVIFFGADWCPVCNSQKERFDDGAEFLPFVEVTNFDGSPNQAGNDNQVFEFPTWQFPGVNGGQPTRVVQELTPQELSNLSGVPIPTSEDPSIQPIDDQVVQLNTPLHIGVNPYDPNDEPLTITVSSSNENVVAAEVLQGNRSLVIDVAGRGTMIFELFEQRAPIPTKAIADAAIAGDFDGNPFHRISDGFVIQGGQLSPTPPTIIDDFHPDLQHTSAGVLSYAKTSIDDSGTTQFFITDRATPFLDFNHPVFGQLTQGEDVRKSIQRSITELSNGQPVSGAPAAVMETVTVINDTENGIVKLTPTGQAGESATVTVTVTDGDGNIATESFMVTLAIDGSDAPPFLVDDPLLDDANGDPQLTTQQNQPIAIALDAIDVEGDAFQFDSTAISNVGSHSVSGNILTVTPPVDFVGEMTLEVTVRQSDGGASGEDEQVFRIAVTPEAPGVVDLLSDSDTGISPTDDITSDATPTIRVNSVESGALVRLLTSSGDQLAQATASGSSIDFTIDLQALGDGPITLKATQEINGNVSPDSVELALLIDTTAPDLGNGPGPQEVQVGNPFSFDATTAEETASDFVEYSLSGEPSGMTIDAATGLVQWTPGPTQRGSFQPVVQVIDAAGNMGELTLDITTSGPTDVAFTLTATDINGDDPGRAFVVGETFLINVFVQDISDSPTGVKNAYLDISLPGTWSRIGNATFGPSFTLDESGQSGALIDELGAGWEGAAQTGLHLLAQIPVSVSDGDDYTLQASDAARNTERFTDGVIDPTEIFYGSLDVMVISPFTAGLDERSIDEDSGANSLDVLSNDEFIDGFSGTLSITTLDTLPSKGTAEIINNDIVYTPDLNVHGGDEFTYVITDDQGRGTVTGTVSVSIQQVNDPPEANDDTFINIAEGSVSNELDVLINDTDVDGDTLLLSSVNSPANGTATASTNNTFIQYTPDTNFEGTETFTYVVTDGEGGFDTATVTVTVDGENDPPVANNDVATVDEDDSVTINVLDNDDVVDGGETLTVLSAVANDGNAAVVGGTQVSYSPPQDFNGATQITYVISDGNGFEATATVNVTVNPVNDQPDAADDPDSGEVVIIADTVDNVIDVLANDTDVDGDALTITSVQGFTNGGSGRIVNNQLLYTPDGGVTGTESFTYTVEDPSGDSSTATVSVNVLEFVPSSLSGVVFLDSNANGVRDAGEAGLAGVTVTLTGTPTVGDAVNETQTTDADGRYSFTTLRAGDYTLVETQPAYFTDGDDTVGSQGGTASANDTFDITLEEGVDGEDNNFAERGRTMTFRSIHDLFRSTSRRNVFAAVNTDTGEVSHWTEGSWTAPQTTVTFTAESGELSVTVEDDGEVFTNTVDIDEAVPPTQVGVDGSVQVIRLLSLRDFDGASVQTASNTRVASEVAEQPEAEQPEGEADILLSLASDQESRRDEIEPADAVFADTISLSELLRSSR